jgi:dienelactone hydrolase
MRILRGVLLIFLALLLIAAGGFTLWGLTPTQPMPEAVAALQSDEFVSVETGAVLAFSPNGKTPQAALILYPGGHVDYHAYAPLARAIAEQGYQVFVPRMPLSLAVLSPARADQIIAAHPDITSWTVGGHSLGGAMAANFAKSRPDVIQGLVLLAAYPASSDDLSQTSLQVLSIYASLDGLATREKIEASRVLLPPGTSWVEIRGGNHAQFGWYGLQKGDNPAEINRSVQQRQIVQEITTFLANAREYK